MTGTFFQAISEAARDADLSTIEHEVHPSHGEMEVRNMYRDTEEEPWAVLLRFEHEDGAATIKAFDGSREEVRMDQEAGHEPHLHGEVSIPTREANDWVADKMAMMILPLIEEVIGIKSAGSV